ncbi:hypothetical protein FACS1894141_6470 [Spirochaetia bacterium]|nr:hypothetical protein FACS1894141_6470 [Spirochaetia bacterium]
MANKILKYIAQYPEKLRWWDQDALNGVLIKDLLVLPFKYNMQTFFFNEDPMLRAESLSEIKAELKDPVLLHFSTPLKPWFKGSDHPLDGEYYKYLRLSPWKKHKAVFPHNTTMYRKLRFYVSKIREML